MRQYNGMIFAALLLASLPVAAGQWPAGGRETFEQGCLISARDALDEKLAKQYCACTVEGVEKGFTTQQIAALQGQQLPPEVLDKLRATSQHCQERLPAQL